MALWIINAQIPESRPVGASSSLNSGAVMMFDVNGSDKTKVVLADRGVNNGMGTQRAYAGILGDFKGITGNTQIQADPVGSTYLDTNNSNAFTGEANGLYAAPRRVLLDFQDDSITNVSNLTDNASGYATPKRNVSIYNRQGNQFITDNFGSQVLYTSGPTTDAALGYLPNPGDLLTYGSGANAGKFVVLSGGVNSSTGIGTYGIAIGRVNKSEGTVTAPLVTFTTL